MDIKSYVDNVNSGRKDEGLVVNHYLPTKLKQSLIKNAIEETTAEINGRLIFDTTAAFIMLIMEAIALYTNLESDEDYITDYDLLNENRCVDRLINIIGTDYQTLVDMFNTTLSDVKDSNSLEAVIATNLEIFNKNVEQIVKLFSEFNLITKPNE